MQPPTKILPLDWRSHKERAQDLNILVDAYSRQPQIRHRTLEILKGAGVRRPDRTRTARAVFDYVQKTLPYHLESIEQIETPAHTLRNISLGADCDGHALLVATLLESVNIPAELVYWTPPAGKHPVHISAAFWTGTHWENLDTTQEEPMGWTPVGYTYTRSTGTESKPSSDMRNKADTGEPSTKMQVYNLGLAQMPVYNLGLYIPLVSEIASAGADLVEGAVDMAVGLATALGDMAVAILETIADFALSIVDMVVGLAEDIGGLLVDMVEKMVDWATDLDTWTRLLMAMAACGPAIAAAGPAGPGVAVACVAKWASTEVTVLAVDFSTGRLEDVLGVDIPDFLEPANLARLADSISWDELQDLAGPAAEELADAAITYAKAEAHQIIREGPARLASYVESEAMKKLRALPQFRRLPNQAQAFIEGTVRSRGSNLANMSQERAFESVADAIATKASVPSFDDMPRALQEELERTVTANLRSEAGTPYQAILDQVTDLSAAKLETLAQMGMAAGANAQGWTTSAAVMGGLNFEIDRILIKPAVVEYLTAAGLEEMVPPTMAEGAIFKRAGRWTGDTAAKMITEGRFIPGEYVAFRAGGFAEPMAGLRALTRFRIQGPNPNTKMLKALMTVGRSVSPQARTSTGTSGTAVRVAAGAAIGGAALWSIQRIRG